METFVADVEAAIKRGNWLERTWWRDSMYQTELALRADQIKEAFSALSKVFSKDWAKTEIDSVIAEAKKPLSPTRDISPWEKLLRDKLAEAKSRYDEYSAASSLCGMHPVFGHLFHRGGLDTFMFLYRMGGSLLALKQQGLLYGLVGRLRDGDQFEGACAELNMLADWIAAGVKVERDVCSAKGKTGQKNCDLKVSDGKDKIFIEIKCLEKSAANKERSSLTDCVVSKVLSRLNARGLNGLFEMELLLRPTSREEVSQQARDADRMADAIAKHAEQGAGDKSGEWRVIDGLARYRHVPGNEGMRGGASGVPLDMRAEADKVMSAVRKAAKQVPAKGPGVVMVWAHGNAALTIFGSELPERIVQRFEERPTEYADISGVLILRSMFFPEHGEVEIGTYVPNPNGPRLSMELLKRGVPNLQEWDWKAKGLKS